MVRRQRHTVRATEPDIERPEHTAVKLDGREYVMLRRSDFDRLCEQAGVTGLKKTHRAFAGPELGGLGEFEVDRQTLAQRLRTRRMQAGLTQAALARLAGIYPESLNRIERGKVNPDFATIRKLVVAIDRAVTPAT